MKKVKKNGRKKIKKMNIKKGRNNNKILKKKEQKRLLLGS
jgi:hypothetical protein